MGAATMPLIVVGAGILGGYSAYKGYQAQKSTNAALANQAMEQGALLNSQYMMQASLAAMQASTHGVQADLMRDQADMIRQQADLSAAADITNAGMSQKAVDVQTEAAAKRRRLIVGAALTAYAGNGVLLESRPDSAAARWEQDEAADLAEEMVFIKHASDVDVWNLTRNAMATRAQGEQDRYAMLMQSISARMDGATSMLQSGIFKLQASSALADSYYAAQGYRNATKAAKYGFYGSVFGTAASTATTVAGLP